MSSYRTQFVISMVLISLPIFSVVTILSGINGFLGDDLLVKVEDVEVRDIYIDQGLFDVDGWVYTYGMIISFSYDLLFESGDEVYLEYRGNDSNFYNLVIEGLEFNFGRFIIYYNQHPDWSDPITMPRPLIQPYRYYGITMIYHSNSSLSTDLVDGSVYLQIKDDVMKGGWSRFGEKYEMRYASVGVTINFEDGKSEVIYDDELEALDQLNGRIGEWRLQRIGMGVAVVAVFVYLVRVRKWRVGSPT